MTPTSTPYQPPQALLAEYAKLMDAYTAEQARRERENIKYRRIVLDV